MKTTLYTFRKKQNTEEIHIFRAEPTTADNCRSDQKSICNKMEKNETGAIIIDSCLSKKSAKLKAAQIEGDKVCGTCVSDLYLTIK